VSPVRYAKPPEAALKRCAIWFGGLDANRARDRMGREYLRKHRSREGVLSISADKYQEGIAMLQDRLGKTRTMACQLALLAAGGLCSASCAWHQGVAHGTQKRLSTNGVYVYFAAAGDSCDHCFRVRGGFLAPSLGSSLALTDDAIAESLSQVAQWKEAPGEIVVRLDTGEEGDEAAVSVGEMVEGIVQVHRSCRKAGIRPSRLTIQIRSVRLQEALRMLGDESDPEKMFSVFER
jgi:hypothetical protein